MELPACAVPSMGTIILAAGASKRMGKPKLVLPWGGTSILGHLVELWRSLGARQIGVVCAPANVAVLDELNRLGIPRECRIVNGTPEHGMFSSIQAAARWGGWRTDLMHWAIVLGDQPQVGRATLQSLLAHLAAHPDAICQPSFDGRARHPVILPARAFALLAKSPAPTLREFLATSGIPVSQTTISDPALAVDLDTPEDYRRALETFERRLV